MNLARSNLRHSAINVDALRQGFCLRIKDSLNQELLWNVISRFKLYGTYVSQPGSPSVPREAHPAEYSGSVKGKLMTLDVKLTDTKQSIGIYKLVFGQLRRLNKCPVSRPQAPPHL